MLRGRIAEHRGVFVDFCRSLSHHAALLFAKAIARLLSQLRLEMEGSRGVSISNHFGGRSPLKRS
jgi:hypothetical protein